VCVCVCVYVQKESVGESGSLQTRLCLLASDEAVKPRL